jgi:hypothetical protein
MPAPARVDWWKSSNPFYLEEIINSLVETKTLRLNRLARSVPMQPWAVPIVTGVVSIWKKGIPTRRQRVLLRQTPIFGYADQKIWRNMSSMTRFKRQNRKLLNTPTKLKKLSITI